MDYCSVPSHPAMEQENARLRAEVERLLKESKEDFNKTEDQLTALNLQVDRWRKIGDMVLAVFGSDTPKLTPEEMRKVRDAVASVTPLITITLNTTPQDRKYPCPKCKHPTVPLQDRRKCLNCGAERES